MRTALAAVLLLAAPVAAQPSAAVASPYSWRVRVQFEPHALMPASYRAGVVAELAGALKSGFPGVGTITVEELAAAPTGDALAAAFLARGFPALDGSEFRELTGVKTHFVTVRVVGRRVELSARQHDGTAGIAPPARPAVTSDFASAARRLSLLVGQDFGPVGTIELVGSEADDREVTVTVQGGTHPAVAKLITPGQVFAASAVWPVRRSDKFTARPREWTLLRAETSIEAGKVRCKVLSHYAAPFPLGRGVKTYRCLLLTTTAAEVAVRLVDPAGNPPPAGTLIQVRASDLDFLPRSDGRDRLEYKAGVFVSKTPLRNVACVVVNLGTAQEERFPVPVTGRDPIAVRFQPDAKAAALAEYELAREAFRGRVLELRLAHDSLLKDAGQLILDGKNAQALGAIKQALDNFAAQDAALTAELASVAKLAATVPSAQAEQGGLAQSLAQAKSARPQLKEKLDELQRAASNTNDPAKFDREFRAKELAGRVRALLQSGEVPDAITYLDQLIELTKDPKAREQKARILAEYEPKSPEQTRAREYLAGPFRQLAALGEFPTAVEKAKDAASTLIRAGDRYGLRLALTALDSAYSRLADVVVALDQSNAKDRADAERVREFTKALRGIEAEVRAKLKSIDDAPPKDAPPPAPKGGKP